jgi:membrane protease YdiL (CAAX protease family)
MSFSRWAGRFLPVLAAAQFGPLLAFRRFGPLDFWWGMSAILRRDILRKIILGLASALLLYLVFLAGGMISREFLPFAAEGIEAVYGFKQGVSLTRITLLFVLVIGPGEEIFWRGYIQRRWENRFGFPSGWLLASAFYALVHVGSCNMILVLSALVCGLFWGALYSWSRSALLVALSHTAWDLAVFVILPFR